MCSADRVLFDRERVVGLLAGPRDQKTGKTGLAIKGKGMQRASMGYKHTC